jgi:hypothetical protein
MMAEIVFPERVFQVWAYTVGMGRLLLRSTKTETFDTRVDVLFQNVKAVKFPAVLEGLVVGVANSETAEEITRLTGLLPDEDTTFYSLGSSSLLDYVVAGVVAVVEDEGEFFEVSELWPGPDGIAR